MEELAKHLPKGFPRPVSDLTRWELAALERVAERPCRDEKRAPIGNGERWAAAQTVSKMEPLVRRDIEKTNHGAFLPTCARFWKVDGREYSKERALFGGYVFFLTSGKDWAGIPDIHGVYRVLGSRVLDDEMKRMVINHAAGAHNEELPPRYTKYYTGHRTATGQFGRKPGRRRRPRPGKMLRNASRNHAVP